MTRATLNLATAPTDTFIQTADWGRGNRGVVFVNGFNIGNKQLLHFSRLTHIQSTTLK